MNFIIGLLYAIAAQILTFVQLQGQFKYQWAKENPFLMACNRSTTFTFVHSNQ
jgi:hypothetical protein